jgi:hypothetical protein
LFFLTASAVLTSDKKGSTTVLFKRIIFYFVSNKKINFMPDNPKKADGKRLSKQPHEQAYQRRKAKKAGSNVKKPRNR